MTRFQAFKRWLGFRFKPQTTIAKRFADEVTQRYVDAGIIFGDAVSYIYMGECIGFAKLLRTWEETELAYSNAGYRTLSLDDFVATGGYGEELRGLETQRETSERPILHAGYYRQHYLGKVGPTFDVKKMMETGEPQASTYEVPSTRHLTEERSRG